MLRRRLWRTSRDRSPVRYSQSSVSLTLAKHKKEKNPHWLCARRSTSSDRAYCRTAFVYRERAKESLESLPEKTTKQKKKTFPPSDFLSSLFSNFAPFSECGKQNQKTEEEAKENNNLDRSWWPRRSVSEGQKRKKKWKIARTSKRVM